MKTKQNFKDERILEPAGGGGMVTGLYYKTFYCCNLGLIRNELKEFSSVPMKNTPAYYAMAQIITV
jgi:hypothetical protein